MRYQVETGGLHAKAREKMLEEETTTSTTRVALVEEALVRDKARLETFDGR